MTKIASMWGRSNPTLRFVNDPSNFNSTYNAFPILQEEFITAMPFIMMQKQKAEIL
jgi:hypothetical protein